MLGLIDGGGTSKSSTDNRASAVAKFDIWRKSSGDTTLENTEEDEFCVEALVQQFAYYLVHECKTKGDENLMLAYVLKLVSGLMGAGSRKFPSSPFFDVLRQSQSGQDTWYHRMRTGIKKAIRIRSIENALKISESATPLSRKEMSAVGLELCRAGTVDAILRRFVLTLLWLAGGRAGEVATTSWNLARWNHTYGILYLDWSQHKTGKQKGVALLPDFDSFNIDIYHNIGR